MKLFRLKQVYVVQTTEMMANSGDIHGTVNGNSTAIVLCCRREKRGTLDKLGKYLHCGRTRERVQ